MLPIISNSAQKLAEYIGYCVEQNNRKTLNIKDVSEKTFCYSVKTHISDYYQNHRRRMVLFTLFIAVLSLHS